MQAIIMVAGKSTRTYPLTLTRPKPLLPVLNRPLIYHNLDQLVGIVDEVILIVGYRKEMIENELGQSYRGLRLVYLEQKEQLGTGHAVLQTKDRITGRFLVLNGDDIFSRQDIKKLMDFRFAVLVMEVANPAEYGVTVVDAANNLVDLVEKPKTFISNRTNVGCYMLEPEIFPVLEKCPFSERGEIELPAAILELAHTTKVKVVTLTDYWMPTGFPWDLLKMQRFLFDYNWEAKIQGEIEKGAMVHGNVQIGQGTIVRSGAQVIGPASIGPHCEIGALSYVGPFCSLNRNVKIGIHCIVEESLIMEETEIENHCIISHSVIGAQVKIGENSHLLAQSPDNSPVHSMVKGLPINTHLLKFGATIGDRVSLGARTVVHPGCKLWPDIHTAIEKQIITDITSE